MKANNGKGNNPSRDEWETPSWIFNPLMKQYKFTFDCCATEQNTKTKEFAKEDFQDIMEIDGVAWMNPPFSKAYPMFRHFFKVVKKGIAIYRCDNFETALWQKEIFPNCSWVFIPNHRVSYEGLDGDGARFPSALIGFNIPPIVSLGGITLTPSFHSGHLIGIKRKPCEVSQSLLRKPSLNSDIKRNFRRGLLAGSN